MNTSQQLIMMIAVVGGVLLTLAMIRKRVSPISEASIQLKETRRKWSRIMKLADHREEMNYKLAVIEADALLDEILQRKSFPGETMDERLKEAEYAYPKLKKVVWAHKMCCMFEQKQDQHLRYTVAQKLLRLFKNALKELDAI